MKNSLTAEYAIEAPSLTLQVVITAIPNHGVDQRGIYQRASWADCAGALGMFLEGIEETTPVIIEEIEKSINGEFDGSIDPEDDTDV